MARAFAIICSWTHVINVELAIKRPKVAVDLATTRICALTYLIGITLEKNKQLLT